MNERIDQAPCGYLSLSEQHIIQAANQTFCYMLNYEIQGLRGSRFESILTRSSRAFFQIYFWPLIKLNGKVEEMYLSFKSSNGDDVPMLLNAAVREREGEIVHDLILIPMRRRIEYEKQIEAAEIASRKANVELRQVMREIELKREELKQLISLLDHGRSDGKAPDVK